MGTIRRLVIAASVAAMALAVVPGIDAFSTPNSHDAAASTGGGRRGRPPPLPITDDPHSILGLSPLSPPNDFSVVHRAYRDLARRYHPDVATGPDATPEERARASEDFARISAAYDDLRARKDEETFEVVMMGGNFGQGKRDRRVQYKTSEKIRESNPDRINYDKIVENRDGRNLKARSWRDPGEYEWNGGRHNGDFGPVRRW